MKQIWKTMILFLVACASSFFTPLFSICEKKSFGKNHRSCNAKKSWWGGKPRKGEKSEKGGKNIGISQIFALPYLINGNITRFRKEKNAEKYHFGAKKFRLGFLANILFAFCKFSLPQLPHLTSRDSKLDHGWSL